MNLIASIARRTLYVALLLLRVPVRLLGLLAYPGMAAAVVWGVLAGWSSTPALSIGGMSVVLFIFAHLYDSLVLLVAPEEVFLEA